MDEPVKHLVAEVEELLRMLQFDDQGMMIGDKWMGGNGGMISRETTQKADAVRRAIHAIKKGTR